MNFPNIPRNPAINHPSSPRNFISMDHFSTISSNKHSAPKRAWDASHRSIHPRNPRPYPRNYSVPPLENIQRKIQKKETKETRKADSSRKFCLFPKLRSDRTKGKRKKKGRKNRKEKESDNCVSIAGSGSVCRMRHVSRFQSRRSAEI